jgi:hypothetical protein
VDYASPRERGVFVEHYVPRLITVN